MLQHRWHTALGALCLLGLAFSRHPLAALVCWCAVLALGVLWPTDKPFQDNLENRRFLYRMILAGVTACLAHSLMGGFADKNWIDACLVTAAVFAVTSCASVFRWDWHHLFVPALAWVWIFHSRQAFFVTPPVWGLWVLVTGWAALAGASWWAPFAAERSRYGFMAAGLASLTALLLLPLGPAIGVSLVTWVLGYAQAYFESRQATSPYTTIALLGLGGMLPMLWFPFVQEFVDRWFLLATIALHAIAAARNALRALSPSMAKERSRPRASLRHTMRFWQIEEQWQFALWQIPAQLLRAGGDIVAFWSQGSTAYLIGVLLAGVAVLLWAALKTQVLW